MKTTCSSCGAVGNIPDGKLPAAGANIRCPSCSHVFFVGPASASPTNVSATSSPDTRETPRLANAIPGSADGGIGSTDRALPTEVSSSRPAAFATSRPGSISVDAAAVGLPRDETTGPPETNIFAELRDENTVPTASLSDDTAERLVAGYAQSGSGGQDVVAMPSAREVEAKGPSRSVAEPIAPEAAGADDVAPVPLVRMATTARASWRVRDALGMVYDFPELSALRTWLSSRSSHEGIQVSSDHTTEWVEVARARELQGLEPVGIRASRPTGVGRMPRTAATVIPAAPSGQGARAFSGAHATAAVLADRVATEGVAPPSRRERLAEARAKDRISAPDPNPKSGAVRKTERMAARTKEASAERAQKAGARRTAVLGVLLVLVVLVGVFAFTRPSTIRIPATPAGIEAQWALDALNDASKARPSEISARFDQSALRETDAQAISDWFAFQDQAVPGFQLLRIERERSDNELVVELMSTFGGRYLMTVVVRGPSPNNITTLNLQQVE